MLFHLQDLERAYMPSQWCQRLPPNEVVDEHYRVLTEGSKRVIEKFVVEQNIRYGPSEAQKLNIVYPSRVVDDAAVLVFIHGGYWVAGCPEQNIAIAEQFVENGAVFVSMGYSLSPKASLPEIVEQVKLGFALILNKFSNSRSIYVSGHSAGGHLAARILEVDWSKHVGSANNPLKGAVLMSGLFNLLPLLHTSVNDGVCMSEEIAKQESPIEHIVEVGKQCKQLELVHVVVGEMESPEFKEQSMDYAKACKEAGVNAQYKVISNVDHFNMIERLLGDDYILTQMIQKMMALDIQVKSTND
ncbi:kynurenine formamidase-like isoform X2 [Anneissia japonica]|uniref:kynurenine formamidase-like isoform X2 n=1 Tax=Anneissia japonica TaxID=1529436 RepID=UPI00142583B6|nr:kynurenine formamidase-like isoform X2 [Anneissia japonica]